MENKTFKGIFASSVDPTQLSLTIEGSSKVIIGIVAWFIASKGLDPSTATTQIQAIIDVVAQSVPIAFAAWSACIAIWGAIRKIYVAYFTK
ncbi:MAG: hypothetical protein KGL39_48845 [Patescibacteria group bacterium]|nr:hypothetical protein [Patescibacteria group bacterium]